MPDATQPPYKSIAFVALLTLASVLVILYAWRLPPFTTSVETTEDAYVRGSVTLIAPKIDGYVTEVAVQDFATVKAGQVLVRLDSRNYVAKLAQARANLAAQQANLVNVAQTKLVRQASVSNAEAAGAAARAQVVNAEAQLARTKADERRADALVSDGSISERERDQTQGTLRQAEANQKQAVASLLQNSAAQAAARQDLISVGASREALEASVAAAQAAVRLAEIDVENTDIRAPRDGQVGEVGVKLGQYVGPGTQLLAVVPSQVWVVANFKEAQTAHMREGQSVRLRVDAIPGADIDGVVERLSPATGSEFSAIKPDNATGNFTKVVQRLPVRIKVDLRSPEARRMRPGMSVVAAVDTAAS